MRGFRILGVAAMAAVIAVPVRAVDPDGWYPLDVPGGRATLRSLGEPDSRERSALMIELIRRLQFVTKPPVELQSAIRRIPASGGGGLVLPMPLPAAAWRQLIPAASPPHGSLFQAILSDPAARLIFHGLSGIDPETRAWFGGELDVLRGLFRDPGLAKSFAMFAPAVRTSSGQVKIPGGLVAPQRWQRVVRADPDDARSFVSRLFADRDGRTAGLYFLLAFVDDAKRQFLLGDSSDSLVRLADAFAACYPRQSTDYPFVLRSADPAILLLNLRVTPSGMLDGPRSRAFWNAVLTGNEPPAQLVDAGPPADAAWLVSRLCAAAPTERRAIFATMLAGSRVFGDVPVDGATVRALGVRRRFPALFMTLERAGIGDREVYHVLAEHARALDRPMPIDDAPVALQQFQGSVALVANATESRSLTADQAGRALMALAAVRFRAGTYGGGIARWIDSDLLPAFRKATGAVDGESIEEVVARAVAGPAPVDSVRVTWEGLDYIVDYGSTARARLIEVRRRQGGDTLDRALEAARSARTAASVRAADAALGQVLASWAYAPHLGEADGGALTGGDVSLRHDLGIRQVNRTRIEQRWQAPLVAGERGSVAGSYLGLEIALGGWSLRRLSSDVIPPAPAISDPDRVSIVSTVSLSDPAALDDATMRQIASAIRAGGQAIAAAGDRPALLDALAERAALSPWRRAALPWLVANEPDKIAVQFSLVQQARLGGLHLERLASWGTSAVSLGCLCLQAPAGYVPELIVGRQIDGMVGAYSADVMFRIADVLTELQMPAALAPAVLSYAMRDFLDVVRPEHAADVDAFVRQASALTRSMVEDYLGAIAAAGPLRPAAP